MRKKIQWIVYGSHPDYDPVAREWYDNPLEHYSRDDSREQAEYDALEVWSGLGYGATITSIVRYDGAL
jgi:hypothetical protein